MPEHTDFFHAAARRPIQCGGISRGPQRAAEVAVSGSVNPQFWGLLASLAVPAIKGILKRI